jgi:hypothetical protein
MDWEFCHPAMINGQPAGIQYVHEQTALALTSLLQFNIMSALPLIGHLRRWAR